MSKDERGNRRHLLWHWELNQENITARAAVMSVILSIKVFLFSLLAFLHGYPNFSAFFSKFNNPLPSIWVSPSLNRCGCSSYAAYQRICLEIKLTYSTRRVQKRQLFDDRETLVSPKFNVRVLSIAIESTFGHGPVVRSNFFCKSYHLHIHLHRSFSTGPESPRSWS